MNIFFAEYAWIVSRAKRIDDKTKTAIEGNLQKFPFIKKDKFVWDHFTDEICKKGA